MIYEIPLRLISSANAREHWAKKARRAKRERAAAIVIRKHSLPCTVTITRRGPRLFDTDNNVIAAKALRDAIADRLGVDDADERVTWKYDQEEGPYGVTVEINER